MDGELDIRHLADGPDHRFEPFRRRGAAECEQAQAVLPPALDAAEVAEVDPVADRDELARLERKGALIDGNDGRREAFREPEQPARTPVREPEQHLRAKRPGDRRSEDGVDRAHVREHRRGPRPACELGDERRLEAQPSPRFRRGAKQPHAAVLRQHALNRRVRDDDELVDKGCERAQLGDGRAEHRASRVDLLRDDNEPHVHTSSTRLRMRRA